MIKIHAEKLLLYKFISYIILKAESINAIKLYTERCKIFNKIAGENIMYNSFITGINQYFELYKQGLKKQANRCIKDFIKNFEDTCAKGEAEEILYRFCREICDEKKSVEFTRNGSLPYEVSRIVWNYLKHQCELENMPQMRWTFELYGKYYNPFDRKCELNIYQVLQKAYEHKNCDQKTVDIYFYEWVISQLDWGAHHFPEGCLISEEEYETAVETAEKVMAEKNVAPELIDSLRYYIKLYQCFREYESSGKEENYFYKICEKEGVNYTKWPVYYFS